MLSHFPISSSSSFFKTYISYISALTNNVNNAVKEPLQVYVIMSRCQIYCAAISYINRFIIFHKGFVMFF